jgi:hypothetical protein
LAQILTFDRCGHANFRDGSSRVTQRTANSSNSTSRSVSLLMNDRMAITITRISLSALYIPLALIVAFKEQVKGRKT